MVTPARARRKRVEDRRRELGGGGARGYHPGDEEGCPGSGMCADAVAMALSPRRRLLRWGSWFAAVNAALMAAVGAPYLWYYFALGPSLAWLYAVVAYVGHLSALAYLTFLLLVPVIALAPRPRLVLPLGVVAASAGVSVLLLDTLVFAANRYHLDLVTAAL